MWKAWNMAHSLIWMINPGDDEQKQYGWPTLNLLCKYWLSVSFGEPKNYSIFPSITWALSINNIQMTEKITMCVMYCKLKIPKHLHNYVYNDWKKVLAKINQSGTIPFESHSILYGSATITVIPSREPMRKRRNVIFILHYYNT